MGSILYMKELPPDNGGNTLFANMYRAYETLSAPIQRLCEGLTAVHDGAQVYGGRFGQKPEEGGFPRNEHPVVRTHPVTGRKALYVNRNFTTRIVGLRKHESDALLEMLYRHSETPEFQCRFAWQPNSIAFWDNRAAHASCDVGLLPAQAAGLSRHRQGRQAVLSGRRDRTSSLTYPGERNMTETSMALITYLTRIQFDFGALKLLEAELQLLGMRRPLIVTDKGVIAAGLWAKVKDNLPGNMPITLYDGTPENPTEAAMRDALKIYKEEGCDGIIAIGGGSPMDLAKAVGADGDASRQLAAALFLRRGRRGQDHRGGRADRRHSRRPRAPAARSAAAASSSWIPAASSRSAART